MYAFRFADCRNYVEYAMVNESYGCESVPALEYERRRPHELYPRLTEDGSSRRVKARPRDIVLCKLTLL